MYTIHLPYPPKPLFTQKVVGLDGADYVLTLEWNMRDGWYVGLADSAGAPVINSRKLTCSNDLLEGVQDTRKPPGLIALLDTKEVGTEPSYEELGLRHLLIYYSLADLVELGVA